MNKTIFGLLALLYCTNLLAGDYKKSVSEIPIIQCKIERLVSFQEEYDLHKSVEFGSQSKPLIDEIEKILSKTKASNQPIKYQLSKADNLRFEDLSNKQQLLTLKQLVESDRVRDVKVIRKLIEIADKNYRFNSFIKDEKNPDYIYQVILNVLANKSYQELPEPKNDVCSWDLVIFNFAKEPISIMGKAESLELTKAIKSIADKYNMEDFDRNKLSPTDKSSYDELMVKFEPIRRSIIYERNLQFIQSFNTSSEMMYITKGIELGQSQNYLNNFGKTISSIYKDSNDSNFKLDIDLWLKIEDLIPSEQHKFIDLMDKNNPHPFLRKG